MKRTLTIVIDAEGETCGECASLSHSYEGRPHQCLTFTRHWHGGKNSTKTPMGHRFPECLAAEAQS